jgi:hypothetical protein
MTMSQPPLRAKSSRAFTPGRDEATDLRVGELADDACAKSRRQLPAQAELILNGQGGLVAGRVAAVEGCPHHRWRPDSCGVITTLVIHGCEARAQPQRVQVQR